MIQHRFLLATEAAFRNIVISLPKDKARDRVEEMTFPFATEDVRDLSCCFATASRVMPSTVTLLHGVVTPNSCSYPAAESAGVAAGPEHIKAALCHQRAVLELTYS